MIFRKLHGPSSHGHGPGLRSVRRSRCGKAEPTRVFSARHREGFCTWWNIDNVWGVLVVTLVMTVSIYYTGQRLTNVLKWIVVFHNDYLSPNGQQ